MQKPKRVLFVGGGSGGHIVPNLAIAKELKKHHPTLTLFYVGSRLPMDRQLVESAGFAFYPIFTGKLRRYFSWRNFVDPLLILLGFFQSLFLLLTLRPQVVFSKGGFVSFPMVLAAFVLRRPVIAHESDRSPGLGNRLALPFVRTMCTAFPSTFEGHPKRVHTGSPIRSSILGGSADAGYKLTGFRPGKPVLLVWGGSLGAQQVNDLIEKYFDALLQHFQICHITGKGKSTLLTRSGYAQFEYVGDELKDLYAITTFAFGRAGANSLAELALMGIPNVLLPLQQNKDQIANADYFESQGASLVLRPEHNLVDLLVALLHNEPQQKTMRDALKSLAPANATTKIIDLIFNEKTPS